jgi:hypothetical protein
MSSCSDSANYIPVLYNQSSVQNIMSVINQSPSATPLLSSLPNWSNISSGPSTSLPICVAKKCANGTNSVNVQKFINSDNPVYACISMTKSELDDNGNKLYSCNDGVKLSELPFSESLPASINALKNDVCISLPNMTLMKDNK